ncbi:MAG: hypothetical protein DMF81_15980, partial [Acidobacteria bacterium]
YTVLARLSAGTARPQQGARAPLQFTANGTRPGQNNYMLDGIDNNTSNVHFLGGTAYVVKPPVDAIAESKVLTSSFGAEYGRAGGAVLSATLKSGSNAFHGSAWEFNRNDGLKAAEFFENARGLKKGRYDANQFGFTAGGPVVKGKTFFFADYEGSLTKQDQIWQVTVPTPGPAAPTCSAGPCRWARSSTRPRRARSSPGRSIRSRGGWPPGTASSAIPSRGTSSRRAGSTRTRSS